MPVAQQDLNKQDVTLAFSYPVFNHTHTWATQPVTHAGTRCLKMEPPAIKVNSEMKF